MPPPWGWAVKVSLDVSDLAGQVRGKLLTILALLFQRRRLINLAIVLFLQHRVHCLVLTLAHSESTVDPWAVSDT
jgi:hypothetical protein